MPVAHDVSPADLLPSTLGLYWGMTHEDCRSTLDRQTFEPRLAALLPAYDLHFDKEGRLERVQLDVYESRDFWDDFLNAFPDAAAASEAAATIAREYNERFQRLVAAWSENLGSPTWVGFWEDDEYPVLEDWGNLAYWHHPDGQLQITLVQQDHELPWVVTASCYPAPDLTSPAVRAAMEEARQSRDAARACGAVLDAGGTADV